MPSNRHHEQGVFNQTVGEAHQGERKTYVPVAHASGAGFLDDEPAPVSDSHQHADDRNGRGISADSQCGKNRCEQPGQELCQADISQKFHDQQQNNDDQENV